MHSSVIFTAKVDFSLFVYLKFVYAKLTLFIEKMNTKIWQYFEIENGIMAAIYLSPLPEK
jgi:hypothetical protein